MCVCELQKSIGAPHNLILHHLKSLKKLGIIKSKNVGRFTFYILDKKEWNKFAKSIDFLFRLNK